MEQWNNVQKLIALYEDIQNNNTVRRADGCWTISTTEEDYTYMTTSALVDAILYELAQIFESERRG